MGVAGTIETVSGDESLSLKTENQNHCIPQDREHRYISFMVGMSNFPY